MVKLGDVCEILSGYAFDSKLFTDKHNDMPLVRIRDVVRGFTQTYTTEDYNEKYVVKKGDLLIGMDGEFNIAPWNSENALLNQRVCKIKSVSDRLDENYLLYFMPKALKKIEQMTSFVTVKHLSAKTINQIEIPLPPLDVQKYIADTLDKAQEIIDGHKKQLEELDNLIKATFYDMFGDPIINEKRWEEEKLMDACDKITDGTHDTPPRYKQGVLLVTGKNVRPFEIDLTDVEYVSQGDHDIIYKRCNPEFKDVLYTNIGVNYGTAAINLFHYEFSMKNVALLKYKRNVLTGEYLQCYLNYKREYIIDQNKTGGAQTFMGLATIKQINIIIPPLDLQNKFAQLVTNIEEQKSLVKQSITESQNLFNSLMSKYFD